MENKPDKTPTRQKILDCAVELFSQKGYTETTIRELASAVGVKEASIYNHFISKNAILECILDEYSQVVNELDGEQVISMLKENPSIDGIMSCLSLDYPKGKEEFYVKRLYVILQEQHRNPIVRQYVSEKIIKATENTLRTMVYSLKKIDAIIEDTDSDMWAKIYSSLLYTFASRSLLGISGSTHGFSGHDTVSLVRNLFELMLKQNSPN